MNKMIHKTMLSSYSSENDWFGTNYTVNLYRGCSHGCIYCDSRNSVYKILNFNKVTPKVDAIEIVKKELKSKRKKGVISIGAMSDPYNPLENKLKLTRNFLEEINKERFGVSIDTKSSLVTRDIDILKKIREHSPVIVKLTITTFNDDLCRKIERCVDSTKKRFEALKELSNNGIYTGVLLLPILPFINDDEENIRNIIREAYRCNAKFVFSYFLGVTLRGNQRSYFYEALKEIFPKDNFIKKYEEFYKDKSNCISLKNEKLLKVFKDECEKYNLLYKIEDIIKDYKASYSLEQLKLF
ncbi:MAG: radical SAM protein [Clostridium perfringens]|nr:radical SAM protein [Clostridium perfringens]